ncbi:MAG: 3-phosphoshikimate 1-carboxyvinyltransferase [Bacteroidetes bacterium]|nr:3-phosphoshikimate 1-carboxyvinyltransferase [Bacteroidota bacterium]
MNATVAPASHPLNGRLRVPGDKSICHRSLLLGAIARGETAVEGFVPSADCLSTLRCLQSLGVEIERRDNRVRVNGVGLDGLREPPDVLDAGNSGTTTRLLSGILAGQPFLSVITGDASLRRRPMDRIAQPLRRMGATVLARAGGRLPLAISGGGLQGIEYALPVASAQVKSCILLAGLYAAGRTTVVEPAPARDHTERMLRAMGVEVSREGNRISLAGGQQPQGIDIEVPGDVSSAAYFLVAGAVVPGSAVLVENVGVNPTRTGVLEALAAMGAEVALENRRDVGGEPVADLRVRGGRLRGTEIGGEIIPRLIDELPVLALAATQAEGRTLVRDAAELRVKESDRIHTVVTELQKMGARIEEQPDGFVVEGPTPLRGAGVGSYGDHRLAMSLAVAALVARGDTTISDAECVNVSFPGFMDTLDSVRG